MTPFRKILKFCSERIHGDTDSVFVFKNFTEFGCDEVGETKK